LPESSLPALILSAPQKEVVGLFEDIQQSVVAGLSVTVGSMVTG